MSTFSRLALRYKGLENDKWWPIDTLVEKEKPLDLGQGSADFLPSESLREALRTISMKDDWTLSKYTRVYGRARLVEALSKLFSPRYGRKIDPYEEIVITIGAHQAINISFEAFVNPGDEVIIIEPFFDCYLPMATAAGATLVFVPLQPTKMGSNTTSDDWTFDPEELKSKVNSRTKLLVLNTPNNPTGKVFTREELQLIADLAIQHDVIVLSDEVYEWFVFPGKEHIKISTLPGMWERTITVGSAGKLFNASGWRIGWAVACVDLMNCLHVPQAVTLGDCSSLLQETFAIAFETEIERLDTPACYFQWFTNELLRKRDKLAKELEMIGLKPIIPDGGVFMLVNIQDVDMTDIDDGTDNPVNMKFNNWMIINKKLAAVPPTIFYSKDHESQGEYYLRFCFCKTDETLEKASNILKNWL